MNEARAFVCSLNQLMVARLQARGYVANVPFLMRAIGDLDFEILGESLQLVVDRHDILRARFAFANGVLMQYPPQPYAVTLKLEDVSAAPDPLAAARLASSASCKQPFALDGPDRIHLTVYRLSDRDHLIALIIDHLAADGMSLAEIGAEWRSLYQSLEAGTPFSVSATVSQYREFVAWQRDWLGSPDSEIQRIWWTDQLRGFPAGRRGLDASVGAFKATSLEFMLSTRAGRQLCQLCTRHRITPFMVILSAYALLLAGLTGDRDLLVATVRANRRQEVSRRTIGHFANLVPLRIGIDTAVTGEEFLRTCGAVCRSSYAHDALPFLDIAKTAWQRAGISATTLSNYSINFVPFTDAPMPWTGSLRMSQMWGLLDPEPLATSCVSLFMRQQGSDMGGTLIFDASTVAVGWVDAFPERLEAIVSELTLTPATSLATLLAVVNG